MKTAQDHHSLRRAFNLAAVLTATTLGATVALGQGTTTTTNTAAPGASATTDTQARSDTIGRQADDTMNSQQKLDRSDRHFVEKAAKGGQKEVRLARLAIERSGDPRVRSFAETLLKDHQEANSQLASLASDKGISLDTGDKEDRHYKRLSNETGADFDKDYIDYMVKDHEEDIETFQKQARKADDSQIASFASKNVPVLQKHLQMAKDIQNELKH